MRIEILADEIGPFLRVLSDQEANFSTFNERVLDDGLDHHAQNFESESFFGDTWPGLAPATLKSKARRGFPVPYPLIATGELLSDAVTGKDRSVSATEGIVSIERPGHGGANVASIQQRTRPFVGWDPARVSTYEDWLWEHLGVGA